MSLNESYQEQDFNFKIWLGSTQETITKGYTNATGRFFAKSDTPKVTLEGDAVNPSLAPSVVDLRLQPAPDPIVATTTNKDTPETPPYTLARTTVLEIPVPEWVLGLPDSYELAYTCEVLVSEAQWDNLEVNDPGAWSFTVSLPGLFKQYIVPAAQFFRGQDQTTWSSPARWVIQLVGLLAVQTARAKTLTFQCGWKSKGYISDFLDLRVLTTVETKGLEVLPYFKEEDPEALRRPSDSSSDFGDWDLLRPESA